MTFISILLALLFEQFKPLRADNPIYAAIKQLTARMEATFNAGQEGHGRTAWIVTMMLLLLPTTAIWWLCEKIHPLLALGWNVLVVYLTLGFRRYSHYYTSIQLALNSGDDSTARSLLAEWTRQDTAAMTASDLSRVAVEQALVTTHRNVFGVFFWFAMPLGPAGAILYRVAEYLARAWNEPEHLRNEAFGHFAQRAYYVLDWVPARLTAIAFAVVGNFEDAIYAWRNHAHRWQDEAMGIILSAGGGALGLRLGTARENATDLRAGDAMVADALAADIEAPLGEEASARALQSTVGLVWRALLLWMLLLLLLSFAVWLG